MRRKTLEEELESILEIDEWEFEDQRGIESFKEFMTERIGFGPVVKSGSLLILGRLKMLQSKIKNENDVREKISLLGLQNLYLGGLLSISISVDMKDKSILRKGRIK
ncbi:MAG: hypothetical protein ACON4O_07465 [Lentimonas sp.]